LLQQTIFLQAIQKIDGNDALKAPLASPTFTGTVTLPTGAVAVTQTAADNSTKLATTAYADNAASAAVTGKQNTLTNSAGLAGALSDETGTGVAVFATVRLWLHQTWVLQVHWLERTSPEQLQA
jgi:hypothetical protein